MPEPSATTSRPFTAASFNQFLVEHKLAGSRCAQCGAVHLPPRAICPHCRSEALEWVELSGRGTLAAFTSIFVGPSAMVAAGFDRAHPYVTGIVTLAEGPSISARIVGVEANKPALDWIGAPMVVEFLEQGKGAPARATLAFRLAPDAATGA